MSIKVQKSPQVEFPVSKFPIDIATAALRDARWARERYLARRFGLSATAARIVAVHAFHNGGAP
jgi:hypothetical protein